jgi:Tol biopolymer transport system component
MQKLLTRGAAAIVMLAAAAACDSPSGSNPPPGGTPGLRVVSGADGSDTIDALLAQPLVVQLNDSRGQPMANVDVGFLSVAVAEGSTQPSVVISPTRGIGADGSVVLERTDAQGRAAIRVRMGRKAMRGGVMIGRPEDDVPILAEFTVQPGAARTLSAEPADTAVRVGRTFGLRASALDRHGNPRSAEGVTYRVASGPATLAGSSVSGSAVGRAAIIAEVPTAADTAWVSVVPEGTIAAYTAVAITNQKASLYTMELDGSNLLSRVTTGANGGHSANMGSAWSADGSQIFYHDSHTDYTRSLYVLDVATGTSRRLLSESDRMLEESWPRFADGWVYFEGGSFDDRAQGTVNDPLVYRVRPDGTGKTQVTQWDLIGTSRHGMPAPSGAQLAFVGSFANPKPLHVLDVATGDMRSLGVIGQSPRWSHDGSEIFYVASGDLTYGSGQIRAIRPDGTGDRAVTSGATPYDAHFDISPDGAYLIASMRDGGLAVIRLSDGLELPVRTPALQQHLMAPSWKP